MAVQIDDYSIESNRMLNLDYCFEEIEFSEKETCDGSTIFKFTSDNYPSYYWLAEIPKVKSGIYVLELERFSADDSDICDDAESVMGLYDTLEDYAESVNEDQNEDFSNKVDKIYDYFTITDSTGEDYSYEIKEAIQFLYSEFGEPLVSEDMELIIGEDINDEQHLYVIFSEAVGTDREVYVNEISVILDSERGFLVHELFHALYQTDEFFYENDDFTIEGLAIAVQYKYNYGDDAEEKLEEHLDALEDYEPSDTSKDFDEYDGWESHYMYVLSGLDFVDKSNEGILEILEDY